MSRTSSLPPGGQELRPQRKKHLAEAILDTLCFRRAVFSPTTQHEVLVSNPYAQGPHVTGDPSLKDLQCYGFTSLNHLSQTEEVFFLVLPARDNSTSNSRWLHHPTHK